MREAGFDNLTVRRVAGRAGVAPATAYNYFSSREHLVTEVFWRRLAAMRDTSFDGADGGDPADTRSAVINERVAATMTDVAMLVADEPDLAAACTVAMLATESDVKLLRDRIGLEMRRRITAALGAGFDPAVLATLEFTLSGVMLQAGMGHISYDDLADRLAVATRIVVAGSAR